jgi:Calx-beta domain
MKPWIRSRYYCTNVASGCPIAKADKPFSATAYAQHGGLCRDEHGQGCGMALKPGAPIDLRPRWAAVGLAGALVMGAFAGGIRMFVFPPPLEHVSFVTKESESSDDAGLIRVEIARDADVERVQTIDYVAIDGSAKAGQDFAATRGQLTFAAGERRKTLTVTLLPDATFQKERRQFSLALLNVLGEPQHVVFIAPRQVARSDALAAEQSVRASSVVAKDIADLVVRQHVLNTLLTASRDNAGEFNAYQQSLNEVNGNLSRARESYLQMLQNFQMQQPSTVLGAMDRVASDLQRKGFAQQAQVIAIMKHHFTQLLSRQVDMDRWAQELSVIVPRVDGNTRATPST